MVALSPFTNSARKVPLQHLQRQVLTAAGTPPDPPLVGPNRLQLYSFYKPGLEAGHYQIDAWQTITSQNPPGQTEQYQVYNVPTTARVTRTTPVIPDRGAAPPQNVSQTFEVVAPQFNLDSKLIDSYYPPNGEQDECRYGGTLKKGRDELKELKRSSPGYSHILCSTTSTSHGSDRQTP
jgi:hypothetical protein